MNDKFKALYSELRDTQKELILSLKEKRCSEALVPVIKAELKDINQAIDKLESGRYGICETTGEEISLNLLMAIPTIKSLQDVDDISRYLHKAIYF